MKKVQIVEKSCHREGLKIRVDLMQLMGMQKGMNEEDSGLGIPQ